MRPASPEHTGVAGNTEVSRPEQFLREKYISSHCARPRAYVILGPEVKSWTLAAVVLTLYAAHQDIWLWRQARPLAFGFLPAGLTYHGAYTLAAAALMYLLVRVAWPVQLENEDGEDQQHS
jgi:hypothetical protein